ncbi:hypothetical protein ACFQ0M_33600 [Kitasatospora aburaviensis]
MKKQKTTTPDDALEALLLRRHGSVVVPGGAAPGEPEPWSAQGLVVLEADLAQRGYVLTRPLRAALARLRPTELAGTGAALLSRIDGALGADRRHRPLFRGFPDGAPRHAHSLYSAHVRAFLLNRPDQPCCCCDRPGAEAGIGALAPCAHLVCDDCHDELAGYGHCPLCDAPLQEPRHLPLDAKAVRNAAREHGADAVLRPLRLAEGTDTPAVAATEAAALLARRTPLNPQDRADLALLLDHTPPTRPPGCPPRSQSGEPRHGARRPAAPRPGERPPAAGRPPHHRHRRAAAALGLVRRRARPAARHRQGPEAAQPAPPAPPRAAGGPRRVPGRHPRRGPRPAPPGLAARRRAAAPYEHRDRFPYAAAAFAVLRRTDLDLHGVGPELRAAPRR